MHQHKLELIIIAKLTKNARNFMPLLLHFNNFWHIPIT